MAGPGGLYGAAKLRDARALLRPLQMVKEKGELW
jgi:hypothetical protein